MIASFLGWSIILRQLNFAIENFKLLLFNCLLFSCFFLQANDGNEAVIFKQVGPVLIRNELEEALETVGKRLEFISGEM